LREALFRPFHPWREASSRPSPEVLFHLSPGESFRQSLEASFHPSLGV
jgi:hypothetical protein